MVSQRDVPYKSESRRALERLRSALEKERYDESTGEALDSIEKSLRDDKMSNLQTYRKEIVDAINSDILLRMAYSEGVIENSLSGDEDIRAAKELLRDRERYDKITTSQDTERK